jgi:coenzyme F420-0:L-glutamate ligase/coenzyme F420-1:gamma-L-glutamate ligase
MMMMMALDFYSVVYGRRSVRLFDQKQIERATLRKILETTTAAPSAHNAQPARFFVIPKGELRNTLIRRMADAYLEDLLSDRMEQSRAKEIVERSKIILQKAPALVLAGLTMEEMWTYPDDKRKSHEYIMAVQSTAASIQNLLLAAFCEGIASCWLCAPLFAGDIVVETLDIDRNIDPQAFVILGYSSKTIDMPSRKAFEEVVHML